MKERLDGAENERTEMMNKCGHLETSVVKLQKEKKEYLNIILELTHNPKDGKIQVKVIDVTYNIIYDVNGRDRS